MRSSLARHRWKAFCAFGALVLVIVLYHAPATHLPSSQSNVEDSSIRPPGALSNVEDSTSPTKPHDEGSGSLKETSLSDLHEDTRTLVIAKTGSEDTGWTTELSSDPNLTVKIYTVDDPSPENPIPMNKGNEAMAYLTHIITHYSDLTTVTIFTHSHRSAWHTNDLLDSDAVKVIRRLSTPYVLRQGYTNLRFHHFPGCPSHIFPTKANVEFEGSDLEVPEARVVHAAWMELFPTEPVPDSLASPCCAQFAISRDRILSVPLSKYLNLRDWLVETPLDDHTSGRVFEWMWHYLWTGIYELCPEENVCYCDGFGVCFGGKDGYESFFRLRNEASDLWVKINALEGGKDSEEAKPLLQEEEAIEARLIETKAAAFQRGEDPRSRAAEAGRPWKEGDGF